MLSLRENKNVDDSSNNKSELWEIFLQNLIEEHPIIKFFNYSIYSPILWNIWMLISNISNLLGFNAIFYSKTLIEKRIYDKHRNDFTYPMRKEFGKIILSIFITMLITIIFKLFNYRAPYKETHVLQEYYFEKKRLRRTIGGILMYFLGFFMWIYSIGFCYLYYHSQISWFYSLIWSLFLVWFIFAPFFLFLLSLFQFYYGDNYILYFKVLFFF